MVITMRSLTSLLTPKPTQFSLFSPKFPPFHKTHHFSFFSSPPSFMSAPIHASSSSPLSCSQTHYHHSSGPSSPFCTYQLNSLHTHTFVDEVDHDVSGRNLWLKMLDEARSDVTVEPILSSYYHSSILSHKSLESALANHLAIRLSNASLPSATLYDLFKGILDGDDEHNIMDAVKDDLRAVKERDPACISYVHCFLNFKGFVACQAHRVAHNLWLQGRKVLAVMIQNRVSEVLGVDIHPGAKIGSGILLDHATGIVVGETAVIGNDVSILHSVTLGGTGKASGDRHPKIGDGVLIGAGTCILGNIKVGDGAKIGAGSVVIKDVPPRTTVVGNPAKLVGGKNNPIKLDNIPSFTMDHTSNISEFYDYCV
ncbi:putative serine O-acetyltransferase [Lupinus albus]|uniref:serine O-acetyltransferase n=1 Tax=Lupinus albus TaxID=3870 RepID=A0A6A4PYB3_LUPAL|nr:putative serine O-acetyltransferase [Lupinus albus]